CGVARRGGHGMWVSGWSSDVCSSDLRATDCESARRAAREARPGLMLLDLRLAGPDDGLDICRAFRADPDPALAGLPVLVLTGARVKESDLVDAFAAGATDYLTKPIKPTPVPSP